MMKEKQKKPMQYILSTLFGFIGGFIPKLESWLSLLKMTTEETDSSGLIATPTIFAVITWFLLPILFAATAWIIVRLYWRMNDLEDQIQVIHLIMDLRSQRLYAVANLWRSTDSDRGYLIQGQNLKDLQNEYDNVRKYLDDKSVFGKRKTPDEISELLKPYYEME